MPYRIRKSIDIDFSHHIRGHEGACINLHGHTWKFEVEVEAAELDEMGFVVDFGRLKGDLLVPCHALLDHALALGSETYAEIEIQLVGMGAALIASRPNAASGRSLAAPVTRLAGAVNRHPGGMKVAVFPFSPTSERLAAWLFEAACETLDDSKRGVEVKLARVYETLHPVESVAEFHRPV